MDNGLLGIMLGACFMGIMVGSLGWGVTIGFDHITNGCNAQGYFVIKGVEYSCEVRRVR